MLVSKSIKGVLIQTFDSETKQLVSQKFSCDTEQGNFFDAEKHTPVPVEMLKDLEGVHFDIPEEIEESH